MEVATKHLRRAVANLWAYEDILDKTFINNARSKLATFLSGCGHSKSALRTFRGVTLSEEQPVNGFRQEVLNYFALAQSLVKDASKKRE
jgi:hypothetical protein